MGITIIAFDANVDTNNMKYIHNNANMKAIGKRSNECLRKIIMRETNYLNLI